MVEMLMTALRIKTDALCVVVNLNKPEVTAVQRQ